MISNDCGPKFELTEVKVMLVRGSLVLLAGVTAVVNDRGNMTIRSSVLNGSTTGIGASTDDGETSSFLVTVDGSRVSAGTNTIAANNSGGGPSTMTVLVGASQLAGGPVTGTGTVRCVGVYDTNYNSPDFTTCP